MSLLAAATAMLRRNEGLRLTAYKDTTGHWTTGIGFNLERAGAAVDLARAGADYESIWATIRKLPLGVLRTRSEVLKVAQAETLLRNDIDAVVTQLRGLLPAFEQMPAEAQLVLIDLCFNLGIAMLSTWTHTIGAFQEGDYKKAARMLEANGKWCGQVGQRARDDIAMLRTIGAT